MPNANQIEKKREDVDVNQDDLLRVPEGNRTDAGLRQNISIGIQYIEAWLRGVGCVPLHNLMEDAATAEISRAQLWQWIRHKATLEDGRVVTPTLFRRPWKKSLRSKSVGIEAYKKGKFAEAKTLEVLTVSNNFEEFLTFQHTSNF